MRKTPANLHVIVWEKSAFNLFDAVVIMSLQSAEAEEELSGVCFVCECLL